MEKSKTVKLFTEQQLKEWPALRLLTGELKPAPLKPSDLVMPVNRYDSGDPESAGLVMSGYPNGSASLPLVWALALRYGADGKRYIVPPCGLDEALEMVRVVLDGGFLQPWALRDLRADAEFAVRFLNSVPLLTAPFSLTLGSAVPDLDVDED